MSKLLRYPIPHRQPLAQSRARIISPAASLLTGVLDDYNDNSINPAFWNNNGGGNIVESGQQLRLSTSTVAFNYYSIETSATYPLAGRYLGHKLADVGNTSLLGYGAYPISLVFSPTNETYWVIVGTTAFAYTNIGNTYVQRGSVAHVNGRFYVIGEDSGNLLWKWSDDGVSWTTAATLANPFGGTTVRAYAMVGTDQANGSTTTMVVDDFGWYEATTSSTPATVTPTTITGTTTISGAAQAGSTAVPATISGNTTISGTAQAGTRPAPATISGAAVISGAAAASRTAQPGTIAATTAMSGAAQAGVRTAPGTIGATTAISGSAQVGARPGPATIGATTALSGLSRRMISWSGYNWIVRPTLASAGPGPNPWSDSNANASVSGGVLTLTITKAGTVYTCVEIESDQTFGYGKYSFVVNSDLSNIDPWVVLGLFTYDLGAPGDAFREIDIEAAKWGVSADPYDIEVTVQPPNGVTNTRFAISNSPPYTMEWTWQAGRVYFEIRDSTNAIQRRWSVIEGVFAPGAETTRLNLWLNNGTPPDNGLANSIDIGSFTFTPGVTTTPPKIATLTESFNATPIDWRAEGASVSGGNAVLPCDPAYPNWQSAKIYDLTSSSVFIDVAGLPAVGNGSTEAQFGVHYNADNYVLFVKSGADLLCRVRDSGVNTNNSVTYNATNHRFWRAAESGGNIVFSTSATGDSWTTLFTVPHTMSTELTAVQVQLSAGYWGTEVAPGNFLVNAVNLLPVAAAATIAATAAISGTAQAGARPGPTTIVATAAISGTAQSGARPAPNTVAAATTLSGSATTAGAAAPATLAGSTTVSGAAQVSKTIAVATIAATSAVTGTAQAGSRPAPATVTATTIVSGTAQAGARPAPATIAGATALSGTPLTGSAAQPATIAPPAATISGTAQTAAGSTVPAATVTATTTIAGTAGSGTLIGPATIAPPAAALSGAAQAGSRAAPGTIAPPPAVISGSPRVGGTATPATVNGTTAISGTATTAGIPTPGTIAPSKAVITGAATVATLVTVTTITPPAVVLSGSTSTPAAPATIVAVATITGAASGSSRALVTTISAIAAMSAATATSPARIVVATITATTLIGGSVTAAVLAAVATITGSVTLSGIAVSDVIPFVDFDPGRVTVATPDPGGRTGVVTSDSGRLRVSTLG